MHKLQAEQRAELAGGGERRGSTWSSFVLCATHTFCRGPVEPLPALLCSKENHSWVARDVFYPLIQAAAHCNGGEWRGGSWSHFCSPTHTLSAEGPLSLFPDTHAQAKPLLGSPRRLLSTAASSSSPEQRSAESGGVKHELHPRRHKGSKNSRGPFFRAKTFFPKRGICPSKKLGARVLTFF
jgi:hypothetical protein